MQISSAKLIQFDTTEENVSYFHGLNVQLTFRPRRFYELNHLKISYWLERHNVKPLSIHYPSFLGIDEHFIENMRLLKDTYKVDLFTLHPKFDSLDETICSLRKIENEIIELGVTLAYENMPGPRGAWNVQPTSIYQIDFSFTRVTLDTTHLPEELNDQEIADAVFDKLRIIHLSNVIYNNGNRHDHLRFDVSGGNRDLVSFLLHMKDKNFNGQVVLEYLPHTAHYVREDISKIEKLLS